MASLVNKLVSFSWLLSDALEIWRLRLGLRTVREEVGMWTTASWNVVCYVNVVGLFYAKCCRPMLCEMLYATWNLVCCIREMLYDTWNLVCYVKCCMLYLKCRCATSVASNRQRWHHPLPPFLQSNDEKWRTAEGLGIDVCHSRNRNSHC